MKKYFSLLVLFISLAAVGQEQVVLTPGGFQSLTFEKPAKSDEKIIETAKGWAAYYNRDISYPYEVYNITANSFDIDAHRPNAFYYRNRGEAYYHRIKYSIRVQLHDNTYTLQFVVKEIFTSDVLTDMTVASFYAPDDRLKEEYLDVKPSIEKTVNGVIRSFTNYMATY